MASIVAALKPDNTVSIICEEINYLPLALVTPLSSNYHHTGHEKLLNKEITKEKADPIPKSGRQQPNPNL
jgi:hypothetical protein